MRIPWKVRAGLRWFARLRSETWFVSGEERHTGLPLSIVCTAAGPNRSYLLKLLFAPGYRQASLGRIWLWNLRRIAAREECALSIAEIHRTQSKMLPRTRDSYLIPIWIRGEVDLVEYEHRRSHSLKQDLRLSRLNHLEVSVVSDLGWLDRFYHEMYLPTVIRSHGGSAEPRSLAELRAGCKNRELFAVNNQAGCIGGLLLGYEDPCPRVWCVGVRDGDREYLRMGAVSALYDFAFRRLAQAGFTRASSGLSRAFLNDGVLRFKQKFPHRITSAFSWVFALTVIDPSPAASAVLRNNPFVQVEAAPAKAADEASPDSPDRADGSPATSLLRALPQSAGSRPARFPIRPAS
jgi:hypothetical protein